MNRRTALSGAAITLVAAGSIGGLARAQSLTEINVTTVPTDSGMQVYYAQDRGFFKALGLNAHIDAISNGGAVVSAVMSGAVDIGESNIVSLAVAHGRGLDLVVIAPATLYMPTKVPSSALIVVQNSPIKTARDLNGKIDASAKYGTLKTTFPAADFIAPEART